MHPRDPRSGRVIDVNNLGFDRVHAGGPPRDNELFRVEVDGRAPISAPAVPDALRMIEEIGVDGAREQSITFNTALGEDGNAATAINGELGHDGEPFRVSTGSVEVWTLQNTPALDHSFHLHGFFFQLLTVDGEPPPRRGWLDTINVPPRSTIRRCSMIGQGRGCSTATSRSRRDGHDAHPDRR